MPDWRENHSERPHPWDPITGGPPADVDYRQDSRTDSTAEEQLEAFIVHNATDLGPVEAVWSDRQDVP